MGERSEESIVSAGFSAVSISLYKYRELSYTRLLRKPASAGVAAPAIATATMITHHVPSRSSASSGAIITPLALGMEPVLKMLVAHTETFHYRSRDHRKIGFEVVNERRWQGVAGPLVYAVTDRSGAIRYIGKWVTATPLRARWIRHAEIHHSPSARSFYLKELDDGLAPLMLWSTSIAELRSKLPVASQKFDDKKIAEGLEAEWISRWRGQLSWNTREEAPLVGFSDGEYWKPMLS